jgi:hypothetical protein
MGIKEGTVVTRLASRQYPLHHVIFVIISLAVFDFLRKISEEAGSRLADNPRWRYRVARYGSSCGPNYVMRNLAKRRLAVVVYVDGVCRWQTLVSRYVNY